MIKISHMFRIKIIARVRETEIVCKKTKQCEEDKIWCGEQRLAGLPEKQKTKAGDGDGDGDGALRLSFSRVYRFPLSVFSVMNHILNFNYSLITA
jgi:hypothetical protein